MSVEKFSEKKLNDKQKEAIIYTKGPLKIIAGPGSGKTEVLVLKALYLITVKGVNPKSIFLVTFTRKASEEFLSRFVNYAGALKEKHPELSFEPYDIYSGTLHSLAIRIMDEFQYSKFEKYRLLGDFEREIFIFKNFCRIIKSPKLLSFFSFFEDEEKTKEKSEEELLHDRLSLLSFLFDFIPQNLILSKKLVKEKGYDNNSRVRLIAGKLYRKYTDLLAKENYIDYTHIEWLFLQFLNSNSEESKLFIEGDGTEYFPGIRYILVDEYQDTNPLDEKIYFTLAKRSKNLTVVGDDNQSLYRFRGAVVDCFINFEKSCKDILGEKAVRVELLKNYRSDKQIVAFINYFLKKHKEYSDYKSAWKKLSIEKKILFSSGIEVYKTTENSVIEIEGDEEELAEKCYYLVKELKSRGIISKYSDVVLLLPSTREDKFAGEIRQTFEKKGIPVYNPRAKSLIYQKEIGVMLGALLNILPEESNIPNSLKETISFWKETFERESSEELKKKVKELSSTINPENLNILELFYQLLSYEPLKSFKENILTSANLARLSQLISSFSQMVEERNSLISEFFRTFLFILSTKSADLQEVKEVPQDMFPIMTIHQSKGLEFPIVIVGDLDNISGDWKLGKMEELFERFLKNYTKGFSWERNTLDAVRKFYVAYSRAQYCLIILKKKEVEPYSDRRPWKTAAFPGFNLNWHKTFSKKFQRKIKDDERPKNKKTS
ncbi:UvrD-helicase domain-containing protein [Desulfurobacterium thermolithotrophum]|uniref:UvrD-helicase domain-containing protein n=1 Tax=Desulfurobacterium thermolithotrophum TaxID=64160 RepID=UPI0003157B8A|nr:ATP-dependent helicase [Desulfurobacterium thermolithotrophum]